MKSLNHDTCHLSRHNSDDKKMADEDAGDFTLLYFLTAKQHKKRTMCMGPPLVTRQVSNLLVGRLSLETDPRPKSWPTLSIVWRRLKCPEQFPSVYREFKYMCMSMFNALKPSLQCINISILHGLEPVDCVCIFYNRHHAAAWLSLWWPATLTKCTRDPVLFVRK